MFSDAQVTHWIDLLQSRADRQPDQVAYTFLQDGEIPSHQFTYQQLEHQSRAIAATLQVYAKPGDRALLLYPPGLEFITAFFGCLYAGVIAVPAYPPRPNQKLSRLEAIVTDAQAQFALTTTTLLAQVEIRMSQNAPTLRWLATDGVMSALAADWQRPDLSSDTLAFLQYTSGSTGTPKGVMVSHGNLLHNSRLIHHGFQDTPSSQGVSWLPLYHDMGLIGGVLQPLYVGAPMILMSPIDFLQKPYRWLSAISSYRATTSGGPNFAYDLACRKITPEQRNSLDLSHWTVAFNGAEPIRYQTLETFAQYFASCGFQRKTFYPCYGMAEATLLVSGGEKGAVPKVAQIPGENLTGKIMVGCGQSLLEQKIVIVDPATQFQCLDGIVGEIWVAGTSVAQGYWQRPEQTQGIFKAHLADTGEGPFLRTGDLGFLQEGELYVTGRLKDLIVIRGRNHYPQDIEQTVEQSDLRLRSSCSAAFSVEVAGEERLVIVAEVDRSYWRSLRSSTSDSAIPNIRQAITTDHELQVYAVLLLKPGSIPKTSSGKIQRHACGTGFIANTLEEVESWYQPGGNLPVSITEEERSPSRLSSRSQTEIQNWITHYLAQYLSVDSKLISHQKSLAAYGLDSLAAAVLLGELETWLGCQLSPSLIWDYPTLELLCQNLASSPDRSSESSDIDLQAEACLDLKIPVEASSPHLQAETNAIFLTGATGFLGAFLLYELLQNTRANLYCLVRAKDFEIGKERLLQNLERYQLDYQSFQSRIIPVLGDISQPQLGLPTDQFESLAQQVDVIYHSAALLNYVYPYEQLKAINVLGTQEILRLASHHHLKTVHYMSSVAVFESSAYAQTVITESDAVLHSEGIYLGYSQSKWVAEKLVMNARDQGLPVCIYRLPFISGHSQTGIWNTDDIICRMIKGCIQLGSMATLDILLDLSPVDYVSQAIVYLSRQPQSLGKAFHLNNPDPIHWQTVASFITQAGYAIDIISYDQWLSQIRQIAVRDATNPLAPLVPFFLKRWSCEKLTLLECYEQSRRPQISSHQSLEILSDAKLICPPINEQLLHTYFSYFRRTGFLADPRTFVEV
jgi:thioester reductase-like protein